MNEQEKKVSSVKALFKDFSYSTFLSFHLSSELIFTAASISSIFTISSWFYFAPLLQKNLKRVWYFLLYTIYFRCNHPLISLILLCSGSLKKKKKFCKDWDFPVLNFRCSFLCYYPVVLVLLCYTSPKKRKKKKKELRIFSLSVLSPLLSFTTIATIPDLQSQRSRRENC